MVATLHSSASQGFGILPRRSDTGLRSTHFSMVVRASFGTQLEHFSAPNASKFHIAIMGDLHLPAGQQRDLMSEFHEARDQLRTMIEGSYSTGGQTNGGNHNDRENIAARVVQLGDLGSYEKGWPGSRKCFDRAAEFMDGFQVPTALILGNHDLEGDEFETDEENLSTWKSTFKQNHYWRADVGPATLIGLSTVRFRSNPFSVHEVHIDDEQIEFLEKTLEEATLKNRPVVLFTHAPPMGSGLKAIQSVHVKNRCAWLNHSSNPQIFSELVQRFPCVKLQFSGHFHLSQNYPDAISIVGGTAFVLTGVIGDSSSRDGHRQSRILSGTDEGFELFTVDHDDASLRLDLRGSWNMNDVPKYLVPEDVLLCDPSNGWLCSKVDCDVSTGGADMDNGISPLPGPPTATWFNISATAMLTLQDEVLVEYDVATMAPIGAVFIDVPDEGLVRLVDERGREVDAINTDGSAAVAVEVLDSSGEIVRRAERNSHGTFFQIFQPNKWVLRKQKESAEAKAALAAA